MTLNEHIRRIRWQSVFLSLFSMGHLQEGFLPFRGVTDYSCLEVKLFEIFITINQMSQFASILVTFSHGIFVNS